MKISQLVAEFEGYNGPDGEVVMSEIDAPANTIFFFESIIKAEGVAPLLMIRTINKSPRGKFPVFQEIFSSKRNTYHGRVVKSLGGKYRVTIDDRPVLQQGFETEDEARTFLRGFIVGFTSGAAEVK